MSTATITETRNRPFSDAPKTDGSRWLTRVAGVLSMPLADELRTLGEQQAVRRHPFFTAPDVDADGMPALLVGGLASSPLTMRPLEEWLTRSGARPQVATIRYGVDCGERTAAQVSGQLRDVVDRTGRRALLVAHSRGGQFARAVAVRHPELVRGLVTLGSPVNRLLGVHPLLRAEVALLGAIGTLGVPGLLGAGCMWGECCRSLRADLVAPFPAAVPFLSVYSRQDRLVDWRSCLDPGARHREVSTTHSGLLFSVPILEVLSRELDTLVRAGDPVRVLPSSRLAA